MAKKVAKFNSNDLADWPDSMFKMLYESSKVVFIGDNMKALKERAEKLKLQKPQ